MSYVIRGSLGHIQYYWDGADWATNAFEARFYDDLEEAKEELTRVLGDPGNAEFGAYYEEVDD